MLLDWGNCFQAYDKNVALSNMNFWIGPAPLCQAIGISIGPYLIPLSMLSIHLLAFTQQKILTIFECGHSK